ncbi:hypothetical protein J4404_03555 [Candidatus Woesearchaeota archaeon]|nr:hypothetical protein [Candidatus Woesearchaeota archaeon]
MKKGISPLIAYILLIGMTVAMSVTVSIYLKNQAQSINFNSKEIEVYCADVAMDAELVCKNSENVLGFNLTNRGYYSISNLTISSKISGVTTTLDLNSGAYQWNIYTDNSLGDSDNEAISPKEKALLLIALDLTDLTPANPIEITITPSITIDDKGAVCNEKVFKLSISNNNINGLDSCPQ